MISIDPLVALQCAPIVAVAIATIVIIVTASFDADTLATRQWTVAYISGLVCISVEMFASRDAFAAVWQAVSDATLVLTVGCLWSGLRALNLRPARTWIPLGAAALTVVVLLSEQTTSRGWFTYTSTHAAATVFLVLGAVEAARGLSGSTLAGKLLSGFLGFCGIFELARAVAGSIPGAVRAGSLSSDVTPLVAIGFVTFVTPLVLALPHVVRNPNRWTAVTLDGSGLLPHDSFLLVAADRLRRAQSKHEDVVMLSCRIENLDEIATAFSPAVRDENLERITRIFMDVAPTMAQVSYLHPHRFLVLWVPQSGASVARVISLLRTEFVRQSVDSVFVLSATIQVEQVWAERNGYDIDRMIEIASRVVEEPSRLPATED